MSTKIEWAATQNSDGSLTAGDTWNPTIGCSKLSSGCNSCYAIKTAWIRQHNPKMKDKYEGVVEKTAGGNLNWTGRINMHDLSFAKPLKQKKPTTYFVDSMSDLFHENIPFDFIESVYMVMVKCKQHTFQVLTKRPERAEEFYDAMREKMPRGFDYIKNIWIGSSIENQQVAYERIPTLIRIPAEIRFLSCEPLLGPLNISPWLKSAEKCIDCAGTGQIENRTLTSIATYACPKCKGEDSEMQGLSPISLVITGGESGAQARPANPVWFRSLRDQCVKYHIDYFFKQNGEYFTKNIVNGLPVFKVYHSYNHFLQNPKIDKGDKAVSVDGTQCKTGVDFAKASYPIYVLSKVGKKKAGNLLDGIEYKNLPVALP